MLSTRSLSSVVAPLLSLFSHAAHAQSAEAELLFEEGARLMGEKKFVAACDAFEASNRIERRAGTLIRLGDCRERNRQLASAWSAYKDALTIVQDPRKRDLASSKVAALEPKLPYLSIMVPDESRIDGLALTRNGVPLDPALWNRAVPVDGGEYVIGGRAPGHAEWTTTVVVPIENGRIDVEVPRFKDLATLLVPPGAQVRSVERGVSRDEPTISHVLTPRRRIAIGVAGGGVAVLATAIVLRVVASNRSDRAYALCPTASPCSNASAANELASSAHSLEIGANVSFGLGAAALVGAGVLWFLGRPATVIAPVVRSDEAGVALLGTF